MKRFCGKETISGVFLVFIALIIGLCLGEFVLRVVESTSYTPIWKPHLKKIFIPADGVMPGVVGEKLFSINSNGIRGDEFSREYDYYILAIGGSTTECLYLDDKEAWPYLTQMDLEMKGIQAWVGNVGKSGARIANHISDFTRIIKRFPFIDAVIVMGGINDLSGALDNSLEEKSESEYKTETEWLWYKKTSLWKLGSKVKQRVFFQDDGLIQDDVGAVYNDWRRNRRLSNKYNTMPHLTMHLSNYKSSLNTFVDIATQAGVRTIFMTQPTMWRKNLSPDEDKLLWFGWGGSSQVDSTRYYSIEVMTNTMAEFNRVLLEVCSERDVECIDLAMLLEKDTSTFYDDCHFNVSGSRKTAEILSNYLADNT
jgi:hypothetical protein